MTPLPEIIQRIETLKEMRGLAIFDGRFEDALRINDRLRRFERLRKTFENTEDTNENQS